MWVFQDSLCPNTPTALAPGGGNPDTILRFGQQMGSLIRRNYQTNLDVVYFQQSHVHEKPNLDSIHSGPPKSKSEFASFRQIPLPQYHDLIAL